MTVRGVYGERSKPEGCLYQVSNARSIGLTEQNIIDGVENVVEKLSAVELGLRNELYHQNEMYFKDKVYRAYGVLANARVLPSSEFMEIMALLKFGIAMNIIQFKIWNC
jgi:Arginine kinase